MINQVSTNYIIDILKSLTVSEEEYKKAISDINLREKSLVVLNCFNGLLLYLKGEFATALKYFQDVKLLLGQNKNINDEIFYNFLMGYINFCEKNNDLYMLHYKKAQSLSKDNEGFLTELEDTVKQLKNGGLYISSVKNDPLLALVKIGQAVAAEKDIDKLMQTIAEEARNAVQADRCTVFLYDKDTDELWSKVALGLGSQELRFNASQGIAGSVFRTGEIINI